MNLRRFFTPQVVRGIEIAGGVIIVLIGLHMLFNWTMGALVHSTDEVLVPDVQNVSVVKALSILGEKGLAMKKQAEEFNRVVPSGFVVRQDPAPGTAVRKDRAVKIVVSVGSEVKQVPQLVGLSLREAEIELRAARLSLGEISGVYSLRFKKDQIVSQDPAVGSLTQKDDLVNVVVSNGSPPDTMTLMPEFVSMPIEDAIAWTQKHDFPVVSIEKDPTATVPADTIIAQSPEPDAVLRSGMEVRFVVSAQTAAPAAQERVFFEYAIPQGAGARELKIVLEEPNRQTILFFGKKNPGSKVKVPYSVSGSGTIKVFVDDILVDRQSVKTK